MSYFEYKIKEIELENKKTDKLGILKINKPPVNALSIDLLNEFSKILDDVFSSKVRAFIFTGEGKAFIAGADISEMQNMTSQEAKEFAKLGQGIYSKIENSDVISIAAVNGFAFGGGLEMALSFDIRIFSEKALVGLPEVTLGVLPGFGGTQRLSRTIKEGNAKYYILTGDPISADEAYRLGLAQKKVAPEDLMKEAEATAIKILSRGPNAIIACKQLIHSAIEDNLQDGLDKEADKFASLFNTSDAKIGTTAFLEKTKPLFEI